MEPYELLRAVYAVMTVITSVCYFYQFAYLFLPLILRKKSCKKNLPNRYAILIAARNEEAVLPYLLQSIAAQDYTPELITTFVVADNCTDSTARIAREQGAVVYERFSKTHIGKGYALAHLLERIRRDYGPDRFDAYLIFDADNVLAPDYLRQMNRLCSAGYPAFCGYRNCKNFDGNWLSSAYGVWYLHDSEHLNHSRMLLGTCCAVNGTGFGFTARLLEEMGGWHFFTLTEDIEFSTWCATRGIRIGYCRDAVLYDEQPERFRVSWRQRTRWVQGGIQVSCKYGWKLLRGIFRGGYTGYACLETLTLSLWGCLFTGICCVLGFVSAYLSGGPSTLLNLLGIGLISSYLSLSGVGALTVLTQWQRIHAPAHKKLLSILFFPIFMLSYLPISLTALFRKFQWAPVEHKVTVSADKFQK